MKRLKEVVTKEFRNPFLDGALTGIYENLAVALVYLSNHLGKQNRIEARISSINEMYKDSLIYENMRGATKVLTSGIGVIGIIAAASNESVHNWKR